MKYICLMLELIIRKWCLCYAGNSIPHQNVQNVSGLRHYNDPDAILCHNSVWPKKNVLFPETGPTLPFCPRLKTFFRQNLHAVKIRNHRSVSQAAFRLHSIVSVQRQHGKTSAQVNHVVLFLPMYESGRYTRKCSAIDGFPDVLAFNKQDKHSEIEPEPVKFRNYRWLYCIHQIKRSVLQYSTFN